MSFLDKLTNFFHAAPPPVEEEAPDRILDAYEADLHRQNLVTLGRNYSPEDVEGFRKKARYGDPRYLYAFFDEMQRLGPTGQISKAREAFKSASPQFVTHPEAYDDDSALPEGADPKAVADARAARDFLQDTLSEHLVDLSDIHFDEHSYGIADSKIRLTPRGNAGRWESIESVTPIPARRHRLDVQTHEWMLMPSPDSWEGVPVKDLLLKPDMGLEGLFFTEIGAGSQHLDQRGLFFQCLVPWGIQQYIVRWRAKHCELHGIPWRVGKTDFSNKQRKADMLDMLKGMGSTAYALVHKTKDVEEAIELIEAQSANGQNVFEEFSEWCTRQFDLTILGHSQVSGVQKGAGSHTSTDQAAMQFLELTNSRLRTFSAQLRVGLGRTLVARNLGVDIAIKHTPAIRLRCVNRDDPIMLSEVAKNIYSCNGGEAVAVEDLVRRTTLRVAKPGEKTLGTLQAASPAPPALQAQALGAPASRGGAPVGIGAEITSDAASLIDRAVREDWPPNRLLLEMSAIGNRSRATPLLGDALAAQFMTEMLSGIKQVQ